MQFVNSIFIYDVNFDERYLLNEETFDRKSFEHFVATYGLKVFDLQGENIVWSEEDYFIQADKFRQKVATKDTLSMYLYFHDSYFKPILLARRFYIIQKSYDTLGIELPTIPRAKYYKEYMMYYYDFCGVLNSRSLKTIYSDEIIGVKLNRIMGAEVIKAKCENAIGNR